ncbi:MAG: oligopeptide transport system substrate-binding protein [Actinomycetota bacterium]|jgi:peptide/nickel transport system substrate-binding protein/oligopeptide transport system substrate-binding protein|nr:oligopeptide transport system substrate-binding protein [Actinomycetota bacterium]
MALSRARALAASCVLLVALSGCTDGTNGVPDGAESTGESVVEPTGGPTPGPTSAVFDPDAAVLNVAISDPSTLDPMRIGDPGSVLVARQLYEGLTRWDPVEERVRPAAAEDWAVSDGGRTFTFRLRAGMSFHDGSSLTSNDFAYAFDRIALKENASDVAYTLEAVDGFIEVNQLGKAKHLRGVSTPDDLTLIIRLSRPYQDFPAVLTHPALVPLSRANVEDAETFLSAPVGNGPFEMAEIWSPGQPVILKSFAGFIDTPELDGIRFLPYPDAAASWLQFVDGQLDVAEVPAGQIEDAQQEFGDAGFKPLLAGYYFGLNVTSEGLKDIRLRRAINAAIDRDRIVTIYSSTLQPPRGIVPIGMPGFEENLCTELCDHDPALAERLVSKIKTKDRSVTIGYTRGEPHADVARSVKEDLNAAGLSARIKAYGFKEYLSTLRDGKQEVYRLGWIAEVPTADEFLSSLFASTSPDNHSGFASSKVDALLDEARGEPSEGKRIQLYKEAEQAILEQVPVVPIGSFISHWAAQPRVQGIVFDVMGGFDAVGISLASTSE